MLCRAGGGTGPDKIVWAADFTGLAVPQILLAAAFFKMSALLDVFCLQIMPRVALQGLRGHHDGGHRVRASAGPGRHRTTDLHRQLGPCRRQHVADPGQEREGQLERGRHAHAAHGALPLRGPSGPPGTARIHCWSAPASMARASAWRCPASMSLGRNLFRRRRAARSCPAPSSAFTFFIHFYSLCFYPRAYKYNSSHHQKCLCRTQLGIAADRVDTARSACTFFCPYAACPRVVSRRHAHRRSGPRRRRGGRGPAWAARARRPR